MSYQDDLLQEQEYKQRYYYYVFETSGRMNSTVVNSVGNFNPRVSMLTEEQFDKVIDEIITYGESEFKLIGTHRYNTLEELNKIWK